MRNNTIGKSKMKTKLLAMAVILMLVFSNLSAQNLHDRPGGLFGMENIFERPERGLMNRDDISEGLDNQAFGQDAPIGSGLLILFGAATGYAIIKKQEE